MNKPIRTCLIVFTLIVAAGSGTVFAVDNMELIKSGRALDDASAAELERQLETKPDDVESRTKLMVYYLTHQYDDEVKHQRREKHIVWMIKNAPDSMVLSMPYGTLDGVFDAEYYALAKQEWERHIDAEPNNLVYLENAANFYIISDPSQCEMYLLRAAAIDDKDAKWAEKLGQHYRLRSQHAVGPAKQIAAAQSLAQFEIAYGLLEGDLRRHLLTYLASAAYDADELEKAASYANKMLDENETNWNHGNNVHHGNRILGRIALKSGNIDEAKARLIASGKTSGSPQLNSFGPNMSLASELLQQGERDTVLEYFELCSKFWASPHSKLKSWSEEVNQGKVPKFGGNLYY